MPKAQDCDFTNQLYLATELSMQPQTAVGSNTMITGLVIMLLAADRSQGLEIGGDCFFSFKGSRTVAWKMREFQGLGWKEYGYESICGWKRLEKT